MLRRSFAEVLGAAILVFFAVGVATLMFGFGFDGGSVAAGVVADPCTEFAVQSKLVHRRGSATKFDTNARWLSPPACPDISGRRIPGEVVVDRYQCGAGRDLIAELL